jgi:hypothetical protein
VGGEEEEEEEVRKEEKEEEEKKNALCEGMNTHFLFSTRCRYLLQFPR